MPVLCFLVPSIPEARHWKCIFPSVQSEAESSGRGGRELMKLSGNGGSINKTLFASVLLEQLAIKKCPSCFFCVLRVMKLSPAKEAAEGQHGHQ